MPAKSAANRKPPARPIRQARRHAQEQAQGRLEVHGEIDERQAAQGVRVDQAEGQARARGGLGLPLDGGCLCGRIRYRLTAAPFDAGYGHCTLCRRASGAPTLAFATVPLADLQWLRGEPAHF
jgi:hypothetical protein